MQIIKERRKGCPSLNQLKLTNIRTFVYVKRPLNVSHFVDSIFYEISYFQNIANNMLL